MVSNTEKSVCYRIYVLLVLLVFSVCCLGMRNLPSYLVTVPVPECEETCAAVHLRSPLCGQKPVWPSDREPTRYELCQLCMARAAPGGGVTGQAPSGSTGNVPVSMLTQASGRLSWKSRPSAELAPDSVRFEGALYEVEASLWRQMAWPFASSGGNASSSVAHRIPTPWTSDVEDATFYNMADGACLHHGEYGILIGYGFAVVFALGTIPAGKVCDVRSRVEVASAALLVWSVATSIQAAAHSFWFLLGCRICIGLAQAFAMPAAISLTADYFLERQSCAVEILSVGVYLGAGCASFSILFAEVVGWRWAVFIAGLLGIAFAPVVYGTVKEPERTEWSAPCQLSIVTDEVFEKSRVARMLIFAGSAKMLAFYTLSAFLPIWYSRRGLIGYTNYTYACWNALAVSSGGLLSTLLGRLVNHFWSKCDWRAPCWIGLIGSILAVPLTVLVLQTPFFSVSIFCFFLLLIVSESWYGPTLELVQASVRRSVRGQAVSMFLVATTLTGNVGPAAVGFLDPGSERIGAHLLWLSVLANLAAATAFLWTAREITIDPVAAGLGSRPEDPHRGPSKAGTAHRAFF